MENEKDILCACSNYERKFWLNPRFSNLPKAVADELKVMSVLFTEDVGGILLIRFDEDGQVVLVTRHDEADYNYDEIGAGLKIRAMEREHEELFTQLQMYYYAMKELGK